MRRAAKRIKSWGCRPRLSGSDSALRFTGDGQIDPTFGSGGQVITSFGGTNEFATVVLLQADGKIVAGNSSKVVNPSTNASRFALARYLAQ